MKALLILLATLAVGLAPGTAGAVVKKHFLIKRPGLYSGVPMDALGPGAARTCAGRIDSAEPGKPGRPQLDALLNVHVERNGTGCATSGMVSTVGDSFYIRWGNDCVTPGNFVIITVDATAPFGPGGAEWKDQFGTTVEVAAITVLAAPGLDARGGAVLSAILGILGARALRRRRPATDLV